MTIRPTRSVVPWETLRAARETGFVPLPGREKAWVIRAVLLPGRLYRVAGPADDRFVEFEEEAEIPASPDGRTPDGTFAVVFTDRGRQTDRIMHLQGAGAPARPRNDQGESS